MPIFDDIPLALMNRILFQQDGAPPHFVNIVRDFLDVTFPNQWIGRRGLVEWPPRSPDLTPLDFFLWGDLKSVVYIDQPRNVQRLQNKIRPECDKKMIRL
jgi:hypothetical protein